jgi:uncharacterized protein (PEP-CTERM system associated)
MRRDLACGIALLLAATGARAEPPPLPAPVTPPVASNSAIDASAVRLGVPGFPFGGLLAAPAEPGRAWTLQPSIGVQLLATDNARLTRRDPQADLISTVTPAVLATIDTQLLQGVVNYAPNLVYQSGGEQRIDHAFNGQVLATLLPGRVFLDLRGAAASQAASGGYAAEGTPTLRNDNRVQTTSFQLSPYVVQRFGGLATLQVGYALQRVTQEIGGDGAGELAANGQRLFSDQDFTGHEVYAIARSGEDFGRLALEGRLSATSYEGSGVLDGAYRRIAVLATRYALTRALALLVEGGYEQQRYAGNPGIAIDEPVWALGTRIALSEESFVLAKYGRRDGFNSATVEAAMALGGRSMLFATYAETLTTAGQRAADLLSTTRLDALGNPVDLATGAPVAQPFASSLIGVQSSLMRIRRAAVSLTQSWPRDSVTLSLAQEERRPVSIDTGLFATTQQGSSASLTWAHALTPSSTLIAAAQYGRFEDGARDGDIVSLGVSLVTQLAPGLSGLVQLLTTSRGEDQASGRAVQNLILVGLRQSF